MKSLKKTINNFVDRNRELIAPASEHQGHRTSTGVSVLLENFQIMNNQVADIAKSFQPNINFVTKPVVQVTQDVDRFLHDTRQLATEFAAQPSSPKALSIPVQSLFGKATVEKNMDAILQSLKNPFIDKIGVYGMGGLGKTETMKTINNHLAMTDDFDKVIWVSVSKELNLNLVQSTIAEQLKLDLSTCADNVLRAGRLSARLNQAKRFLIIFDDVWEHIPLVTVGIPEPNTLNKCKIILTTRSLAVCHAMGTDKNINLNLLAEEDAWELFLSKAGDEILSLEVRPLAEELVQECGGLPLAINTVGRAMRDQVDISTWREALESIRNSSTEFEGMETIFHTVRDSYSHLKNDTVRKCFLYLAIFPKDYAIKGDELVRYWIADGCINEKWRLQSKIDKGLGILRDLIDACMCFNLTTGHIKMHPLIRYFANNILEDTGDILIRAGMGLSESPSIDEWEKPRKISLETNMIESLPDHPNCLNLSFLILRENPLSWNIYSSFFAQMPSLKFLDLSQTGISELPSSLSELINLHALYLQECTSLVDIPSLAKLKELRELNLFHTAIKELPPGMEGLISLRTLDLSFTCQLENLTIPKLPLLEELYMERSKFWCLDSPTVSKGIEKIRRLDRLEVLSLSFVRLDDYLRAFMSLQWESLKIFSIRISHTVDLFEVDYSTYRQKFVSISNQQIYNHSSTLVLPPYTQELNIMLCDIPRLSELLCLSGMRFLVKCHIERSTLLSGGGLILGDEMEENTLTSLQSLSLENIRGLTALWTGAVHYPCFTNLRVLEVRWCGTLKTLFCTNVLEHLKNIEVIKVRECKLLEKIVQGPYGKGNENVSPDKIIATLFEIEEVSFEEEHKDDSPDTATKTIDLPGLHTLILQGLPELHTISKLTWVCASLRHIVVYECPKLKKLPFDVGSLSTLETIKGEREWWEALEWDDNETKNHLQHRFENIEEMYRI